MRASRESQPRDRRLASRRLGDRFILAYFIPAWAVVAGLLPFAAAAQSFDCRKARDAVDRAICASPRLRQLDSELAQAYAAALKRDTTRADPVRQAQQYWAKGRAACTTNAASNGSATAEQCLATAYATRLAALAAAPMPAATPPATTAPSSAVADQTQQPDTAAPPVPAAPLAAPSLPARASASGDAGPGGSTQPTPAFAAPRLAAGLPAPPAAAATLERSRFPSAGETGVLLRVTAPGRFAIRAESPTGTALQLVDMLTGPGDRAGWPGKQDGRIDALLDTGVYKLRAFGDPAATGETALSVAAFAEAGPAQLAPGYQPVALTLGDLRSRSFWLAVGDPAATTRIEAAGRSLAALKLWRDGRELVELPETASVIAPVPAHPMTDIVLSGQLPPGTYMVTAYGGPKLPWTDGEADEPLYLRTGRSTDLLAGGGAGQVGVFGTEVFDAPPDAFQALLSLPRPADARLSAEIPGADPTSTDLSKNDRAASALLDLPGKPGQPRVISLLAASGQSFTLRPLAAPGTLAGWPGRSWFGAAEPANGGDEAPAAAILTRVRIDGTGPREPAPEVLATPGVPAIGPGNAWRTRFNLRGDTALLFQATDVVTVTVRAEGPPVTPLVTTIDGAVMNAMGDGRSAASWSLSPGWYFLVLNTKPDGIGILDLTLGPPGLVPPAPESTGPAAPILPLGEHAFDARFRYALAANRGPAGTGGVLRRPVPVELADGPLVQTLAPGATLDVAIQARNPGILVTRDISGGAPWETRAIDAGVTSTVTVAATDHARTVAIAVLPPPPAAPDPAPAATLAALRDGQPAFLDLDRDEPASFALTVAQGGLYRVETTGRLKTAGSIGTAFIPVLAEATANGTGGNMLLQRYLRGGRYRLDVTAHDSAGHLGVSATATALTDGAELRPGGSVRTTLSPGRGVGFPIRIADAGRYHLDLLGDGRTFSARLEDADGWPLRAAGDLASLDQDFAPGQYRLIVQPPGVPARVVARLRRTEQSVPLTGHGPHALPFDLTRSLEWREPPARDDPRAPDVWTFGLAGPDKVTLSIEGDGMSASLQAEAAEPGAPPLGRLLAGTPLTMDLPAGQYRVAAASLGRNDRLAYTISLHSDGLQPDTPRTVTLPVELPFAIAQERVVTLSSFGKVPLRAELHDDSGRVLARAAGRTDDWNIALSRLLPAGRYRLALARLAPPAGRTTSDSSEARESSPTDDADSGDAPDSPSGDAGNPSGDQPAEATSEPDQDNSDQPGQPTGKAPARTEVTLLLPPDAPTTALASDGTAVLGAGGIQHAMLPEPAAGSLLIASAEAQVELILALERRTADGAWHTVAQDQGLAPILGVPVGAGAVSWRIAVWTVDGGTVPIRVAARGVTATPAPVGSVPLAPVVLGGITRQWNVARMTDPGAVMLRLTEPFPGLLATSAPDLQAEPPADSTIAARSDAVWLMAPEPGSPRLAVVQAGAGSILTVGVPAAGGRATLPVTPPAGSALCAFVATSGLGQPGLEAGRGMGVAEGSAFALCGGATLSAWNAGGDAALRLRLGRHELTVQPDVAVDQAFAGVLAPHAAVKLGLPTGSKRLDVSLAAGGALVAGWRQADAVTVWAGGAALSRSLTGGWTEVLLVNTGDDSAPVTLTVAAIAEPPSLASGGMFRRFFGARGSFVLPFDAKPGQRLLLAGDATALVQRPDGGVLRGGAISLDGPASAVVTHGAGPLALWIEGPGVSPWPDATPRDATLPLRVTLVREAMALRLSPGAPVLLRLASSAPAILAVGTEPPVLFGKGVALARYLPAGDTTLRLLSPQDGPLSGTLELSDSPVIEAREGLGAPVAIPPGGAAVFGFTVTTAGTVGLGVRADPDRVAVRLLDEHGETLQSGVSMLRPLVPGRYLLEATVPPDAPTTVARAAVLGIVPHSNPPPPEVIRGLLLAAGLAPPTGAH